MGIVVELKKGRGDQLVVARHGKHGFLAQLYQIHPYVFLGLGDVSGHVRVAWSLEIGPPPVANDVLNDPVVLGAAVSLAKRLKTPPPVSLKILTSIHLSILPLRLFFPYFIEQSFEAVD